MNTSARTLLSSLLLFGHLTGAHAVSVTVDANTRPWEWDDSKNTSFFYGIGTPLSPVALVLSDLGATPGVTIRITATGAVSAGTEFAFVDPAGDLLVPGTPTAYAGVVNDGIGDSGGYFPSRYTPADWDTNLMALMGTFSDVNGVIVGTPFEVGHARDVVTPAGASLLLLGINDDVFGDNAGNFDVTVAVVPEPSSRILALVGGAMLALALGTRRRRASGRA
jgi:hypothetical protein